MLAEELEDAANEGNIKFISDNNKYFIDTVYELIDNIYEIIERGVPEDASGDEVKNTAESPDKKILEKLLEACEDYDMDRVDECMLELEKFTYTADGGFAKWLREKTENAEFMEIAARLKEPTSPPSDR